MTYCYSFNVPDFFNWLGRQPMKNISLNSCNNPRTLIVDYKFLDLIPNIESMRFKDIILNASSYEIEYLKHLRHIDLDNCKNKTKDISINWNRAQCWEK